MSPKFGTSGLRGLVTELTDPLCAGYAEAFLSISEEPRSVLIGCDLRTSSARVAAAAAAGAARRGIQAIDCGVLPTPALALAATQRGCPAIMITGSHIPDDRNGIKFYTREGEITKDDETRISAAFVSIGENPVIPTAMSTDTTVLPSYLARYTGFFRPDALSGLRIGVYEHSSAARDVLGEVLAALDANVVPLGRSDHFVPVDTEAVDPETRKLLAGWTRENGLDAIVSTDGDADRPMVTDASGRIVPGDILGPLTARYLGADTVVTPVSSNSLVDLMGTFTVARTRIGSPYVISVMDDLHPAMVVGYEANGGFLCGFTALHDGRSLAPLMTRDSLLPIIAPLAQACADGVTLAALVRALPHRRTAADRLTGVQTEVSARLVAALQSDPAARHDLCGDLGSLTDTDLTDGCRMTFDNSVVVHLRPSGNAPELRVYVEADNDDRAAEVLNAVLTRVQDHVSGDV